MDRTIDYRYAPSVIQTNVGLVDDPHKTIVREDGSLNYGYESRTLEFLELDDVERDRVSPAEQVDGYADPVDDRLGFAYRLTPQFAHEDELLDREQTYGDPGAAFVTTTETYEETTLSWTTFAYADADGLRADVIRWVLSASESFGRAPSRVELRLDGPDDDGLPTIVESPGTTAYWSADAVPAQQLRNYAFLESGDTREGVFAVVHEGEVDPGDVTVEWADDAAAEMEAYWDDVEPFRNRFEVPDGEVMALLTAAGRNVLQAREEVDGVAEFRVGPTEYRGLWIVDEHFILEAAHLMGRGEAAFEQGVLSLLHRLKPDGAIQVLPRHYKETGIAMFTVVRQCELADADDRLAELWPVLRRGLAFLEAKHEEAAASEDSPARKLFPPAFLDGGILGPFPGYPTALWVLAGLRAARDAGQRLDLDGHEAFGALHDDLLAGLHECAARDVRETDEGVPYLPMNMVDRAFDRPQTATWALAHATYPGEVFPPDHEYVRNLCSLLDAVDDRQGLPANTGWMHDQGVWTYGGTFYGLVWLYAGEPEKAVDYLYAFANHAAPNRAWREEQAFADTRSAEFLGDMPHSWAAAEFVRHVRSLLAFERGDDLELLPALPEEWLPAADEELVLEGTPTRFGPVDLRLSRVDDGAGEATGDTAGEEYRLAYERTPGNREPAGLRVHVPGEVVHVSVPPAEEADGVLSFPGDCTAAELRFSR